MDLSVVEKLLECSICFERFDETNRVLPCQHTFCNKCLLAVKSNFNELKCPECRTKYNGSIEDLPCNIFVVRILEQLKLNEKNANFMKSYQTCSSANQSKEINVIPAESACECYSESIHALEQSMCRCVINNKKSEVFHCGSKIKNVFENQKHPALVTENNIGMYLDQLSDEFIPNRISLKATRRFLKSDISHGMPSLPYKSTTVLQSTFPKVQSIHNEKPFLFTATYDNECQSELKAVNHHKRGPKPELSSFTKIRNTFKEKSRDSSYNEKLSLFNLNSICEFSDQSILSVTGKHLESSLLLSKSPRFLRNSVIESQFSTKVENSCTSKQLSDSNLNNKEEKLFVRKFDFNQKNNAWGWECKLNSSVPQGKPFIFTATSANEEKQFPSRRKLFMFGTSYTSKEKSFLSTGNTKSTCKYNGQSSLQTAGKHLCETSMLPPSSKVHSTDKGQSFLFNTNTSTKEKSYIPRSFHATEGNPFMFTSISANEGKQLVLKLTSTDEENDFKYNSPKEKPFVFTSISTNKDKSVVPKSTTEENYGF